MTDEADALCAYLPAVVRDGGVTERERKFVASVIHQRRRWPGRALSQAQIGWLRRIVRAFQDRTKREPADNWRSVGEIAAGMVREASDGR